MISASDTHPQGSSTISEVPLDNIEANPNQPRREFDDDALHELAASIREIGIIQPITLRRVDTNHFQIVAGERRWRAAMIAGLTAIPAYIRTIKDENVMEMALVENIQREDLNAIEVALAYERLLSADGATQEKVAERVGKSRAAVANYLRLLKLPAQVQVALQKKEIDMGHARALLSIDSPSLQIKLFREIQKNSYSVRKVEELVRRLNECGGNAEASDTDNGNKETSEDRKTDGKTEGYDALRERLTDIFGTKVKLTCSAKGKGRISIPFDNTAELERIMACLKTEK